MWTLQQHCSNMMHPFSPACSLSGQVLQHLRCGAPKILALMPIRPMGRVDLTPQCAGTHTTGSVLQVSTDMSPKSVNHVSARFDANLLAIRQGVRAKLRVVRPHPCLLAIDQEPLLLVHNIVVNDPGQSKLVRFCPIGVKYHLSILQELLGDEYPLSATDRTGAGRPRLRSGRLQSKEHQCLWVATTMSPHCSHLRDEPSSQSSLPKSTSSASTSHHFCTLP